MEMSGRCTRCGYFGSVAEWSPKVLLCEVCLRHVLLAIKKNKEERQAQLMTDYGSGNDTHTEMSRADF